MADQPDKEFLLAFGQHITKLRTEKGYSILELKDLANISRAQLYKVESGSTNPSLLVLKRLAEALEVSLEHLLRF